jgi:hypothetical protein
MFDKMKKSILAFFILLTCFNFYSFSQGTTAEVRGFIYNKENGEPIIFTSVVLKGTTYGASTDVNGFYSISKVPPGTYTLSSSNIGFDTIQVIIELRAGQRLTQNLYAAPQAVDLKVVDVSGAREESKTETQVSVVKITPKQITAIPSVGGEADLAQYLQVVPGVIFTGDQGGQLYIRGGSPIQNKVLLDGMTIYNPFHSIGLFSVFETDIIRNVDVYTGGFGAEYGGRISAVMDITTRDGNKKRFGGKVSATPFTSKLILEGPLSKYEEGKGTASYIFSGRTSYLEQTSKAFYSYADTAGLPYNFTDLYGKISLNGVNGSKINFFGFRFNDKVNYKAPAAMEWSSTGFGSNFVFVPASSSVLIDGIFAYSGYEISMQEEAVAKQRSSQINGFNSGLNFTYFLGSNEFKYGFELLGFKTDFVFYNETNSPIQQQQYTTEAAGYLKYKYANNRIIIEPSVRAHYYSSLGEMSIEPRLSAKYLITENIRIKAAAGYYSQNLMSATSDRDVVNLFYGFLSGPDDLPDQFDGKDVTSALQKARHLVTGLEIDFLSHWQINIEPYVKLFNQLTNINRDKIYEDNKDNANKPDFQKKDFIIERGLAKGIDLALKYDYKKIYFWATYSLAYVDRFDGIRTYYPHYDRRHNINLITSYTFGKKETWEFDVRWNFGSGFPFTQTQGFYEKIIFENINQDYTNANGNLSILYGELNGGRLPYYHRLDMTIKKKWNLSKYSVLEANAGATNIYNRENIFYFNRVTYARKNQLPFLPTVGISCTF